MTLAGWYTLVTLRRPGRVGPGREEVRWGQTGRGSSARQTIPLRQLPCLAAKIDDTQAQVAELP